MPLQFKGRLIIVFPPLNCIVRISDGPLRGGVIVRTP
jgi:hypothetical protein